MLQLVEMRPEKSRRVMSLHADQQTQERMLAWAQDAGFDLGWNYDGWPIAEDCFRFHVTLLATENEVEVEDRWQSIGPLTVAATGFEVLGADRRVPVLRLADNAKLSAMRQFFIDAFGAVPTYPEFTPHVTLSYKWPGAPDISRLQLPTFPLTFDYLVVAVLEGKTTSKDSAGAMPMQMSDGVEVSGTRRTKDGYLVADVRAARTGIQQYLGSEVGRPDLSVVNVYRPADEVFKTDSLASYGHKPVTFGHPPEGVTADNWKQIAVGNVGGDVIREGGFVRVPLVVMDAQAIQAIESGTRELSMGYECRLEFADGVTPDGEAYQAIQRDIRINHAAIVERGRAGSQCRIGDGRKPGAEVQREPANTEGNFTMNLRKIQVDGLTIETTDQGAEAIAKLNGMLADKQAAVDAAKQALADATAAVAKLKTDHATELEDLKKQIPTVDALESMLDKRNVLVDAAKKLVADLDCKGKSSAEIRKAVVAKKLGDEHVKDRSDDYIAAQFDALAALNKDAPAASGDPIRDALKGGVTQQNDGRAKHLAAQAQAWAA